VGKIAKHGLLTLAPLQAILPTLHASAIFGRYEKGPLESGPAWLVRSLQV
jgi:hypothetical protein